jgi:tight adherence protein B
MGLLIFLFLFALVLSFAILMLATRPAPPSKSMQQRLITIQQPLHVQRSGKDGAELENGEERNYTAQLGDFLKQYQFSKSLQILLIHSGSSMSVGSVALTSAALGLVCALAVFFFFHSFLLALAALVCGSCMPGVLLRFKRARRLKAFNTALPDAIDLMTRALRAGHSMSSAIELVTDQSPEPLSGEFGQVYQQQKFGLRFREALLQMSDRVPSRDLQFIITAILVQKETGGDLTEILERTSHVIRERVRMEGEVRTRTAQGRLTGWILGLLPVIMLGLINLVSPGYSSVLFHDPTGRKLLYAGATMILIGGLVIRKVVDVEV